jgi:predicted cupin superfamily sugar epimerase
MNYSDKLIKELKMTEHPEGGYFVESFRNKYTSLLKAGQTSHWHRLTKDEILHFYLGAELALFTSEDAVNVKSITLNNNKKFHTTVKAGTWFSMKTVGEYSLIGCTVSPPFDYKDFELAPKNWRPK